MQRKVAISFGRVAIAMAIIGRTSGLPLDRAGAQEATEPAAAERLLDRAPFDRITLDAANNNATLDVQLLDFPDRKAPSPLPEDGTLQVRLLDQPSVGYSLKWSAVERVELFEQLLLKEARRLTEAGEFAEAFEYFAFLNRFYPNLAGVENAFQQHLWRDAIDSFTRGEHESALPALESLYRRNPDFPRLANAVESVSGALLTDRWQRGDVTGARQLIDLISASFPQLDVPQITQWRTRLQTDAQRQLEAARQALDTGQYKQARQAVQRATAILPEIRGAKELLLEIHRAAPEIRVAVFSTDTTIRGDAPIDWQSSRLARLLRPRLFEQIGFGAEGGIYRSSWVTNERSDDGLETTLQFTSQALQRGFLPEQLSLSLLRSAESSRVESASLDAVLAEVDLRGADEIALTWRRPHVRPEALLQTPLVRFATEGVNREAWTGSTVESQQAVRFSRKADDESSIAGEGRRLETTIVELVYDNDEAAVQALLHGDVDVMEAVPPWQIGRFQAQPDVRLGRYRTPTVHVLLTNASNPLLGIREFRRAICYGIDREGILRDLILAGDPQPGFRVLSGPLPAGVSLNDPVGYAYAPDIAARPFEPRLAKVLVDVARATLAKRQESNGGRAADDAGPAALASPTSDEASSQHRPPLEPLVLAHSGDPIALLACQTIKLQLEQAGIPIRLQQLSTGRPSSDESYDLLYMELAPTEPLVDARRILGKGGLAPKVSAIMSVRLSALDRAANWNEVQNRAKAVHRVAHQELHVIPLWQTVRHFAYRDSLQGIDDEPVSLYQKVDAWQKTFGEVSR